MNIVIVTLGFAPARVLLSCLEQVYKTIGLPRYNFHHVMLNNHYPVNEEINDKLIKCICDSYLIELKDRGENLGLAKGYNTLIEESGLRPGDIIIAIDPDTYPITHGWGRALVDVAGHPDIGWASLCFATVRREFAERGYDEKIINGRRVALPHQTCMSSICAFRYDVWKAMGGISEPKKYYGGAEGTTNPKLVKLGLRWAYLTEFEEEWVSLVESEPLYKKYKWAYAHENSTELDFKSWLKEQGHL